MFIEKHPRLRDLQHSLDVWHKAKSLGKMLHKAAKAKEAAALKPWIPSIINLSFQFQFSLTNIPKYIQEYKYINNIPKVNKTINVQINNIPNTLQGYTYTRHGRN